MRLLVVALIIVAASALKEIPFSEELAGDLGRIEQAQELLKATQDDNASSRVIRLARRNVAAWRAKEKSDFRRTQPKSLSGRCCRGVLPGLDAFKITATIVSSTREPEGDGETFVYRVSGALLSGRYCKYGKKITTVRQIATRSPGVSCKSNPEEAGKTVSWYGQIVRGVFFVNPCAEASANNFPAATKPCRK